MSTSALNLRHCATCRKLFQPVKAHYWQCFECWRAHQAAYPSAASSKDRIAELEAELAREKRALKVAISDYIEATHELADTRKECEHWQRMAAIYKNLCGLQDTLNGFGRLSPAAELSEWIPRLLQLCHPDRHSNSETANKVTAWLLGVCSGYV